MISLTVDFSTGEGSQSSGGPSPVVIVAVVVGVIAVLLGAYFAMNKQ